MLVDVIRFKNACLQGMLVLEGAKGWVKSDRQEWVAINGNPGKIIKPAVFLHG